MLDIYKALDKVGQSAAAGLSCLPSLLSASPQTGTESKRAPLGESLLCRSLLLRIVLGAWHCIQQT